MQRMDLWTLGEGEGVRTEGVALTHIHYHIYTICKTNSQWEAAIYSTGSSAQCYDGLEGCEGDSLCDIAETNATL